MRKSYQVLKCNMVFVRSKIPYNLYRAFSFNPLDKCIFLCYNTNKCSCFGEGNGEKQLRNGRRKGKEAEKTQ